MNPVPELYVCEQCGDFVEGAKVGCCREGRQVEDASFLLRSYEWEASAPDGDLVRVRLRCWPAGMKRNVQISREHAAGLAIGS